MGENMQYKGLSYLKRKLLTKQQGIRLRYNYYAMKNIVRDLGISTPPELRSMMGSLGWCAKAVDSLADRLSFREFKDDLYDMNSIYRMNNPDVLFDSAILSALISSCSFIYISEGKGGMPRLQIIDGLNATGIIDPFTGMLTEGYAVLSTDENGMPKDEAYFTIDESIYYSSGKVIDARKNPAPYALLAPVIYRPDAIRPFGRSRISRSCMDIVDSAIRGIKRSEIAAEFYSYPQKYVTGLSQDVEAFDSWKATMSSMLTLTKDEEGDSPTFGQFTTSSMQPHTEQLRMFASLFAGETGLTLDDLGFSTDNPSSAEAIKASHETLRLTARKAQRFFSSAFLNAGFLAACLRDDFEYNRSQLHNTKGMWDPIFEPDMSTLSSIGDGAIKLNQAVEGYIGKDNLRELTGIEASDE